MERDSLKTVLLVSIIVALAGFMYVGGAVPTEEGEGLYFSPSSSCEKMCEIKNGVYVYMGCESSFNDDPVCAVTCSGVVAGSGKMPIYGETPCEQVSCSCA